MVRRGLAVALLTFSVCAYAQNPARVETPDVKAGDRWVYQTIDGFTGLETQVETIEVIAIDGDGIRTRNSRASGGSSEDNVYGADWNGRRVNGRTFSPRRADFSFPLEIGKTWEANITHPNLSGDGDVRQRIKGTVVGWESVKVPAGTFNSIKIVLNGSYVNVRSGRTTSGTNQFTHWYAPEVRRIVRFDYEERSNKSRTELVEFTLK